MQLRSMLRLEGGEGNGNWPLNWFELAGVSWSEFAAGTLRAQPLRTKLRRANPFRLPADSFHGVVWFYGVALTASDGQLVSLDRSGRPLRICSFAEYLSKYS
jgi:hypothetical protein